MCPFWNPQRSWASLKGWVSREQLWEYEAAWNKFLKVNNRAGKEEWVEGCVGKVKE